MGGYLRGERETERMGDLDTLRAGDALPLRAGLTDLEADLDTDLQAKPHITPVLPCITLNLLNAALNGCAHSYEVNWYQLD